MYDGKLSHTDELWDKDERHDGKLVHIQMNCGIGVQMSDGKILHTDELLDRGTDE